MNLNAYVLFTTETNCLQQLSLLQNIIGKIQVWFLCRAAKPFAMIIMSNWAHVKFRVAIKIRGNQNPLYSYSVKSSSNFVCPLRDKRFLLSFFAFASEPHWFLEFLFTSVLSDRRVAWEAAVRITNFFTFAATTSIILLIKSRFSSEYFSRCFTAGMLA